MCVAVQCTQGSSCGGSFFDDTYDNIKIMRHFNCIKYMIFLMV